MKGVFKMYAVDFEYDNQYLSDFGFIICEFDASSGATVAEAGSKITFNKVSRNSGKSSSLTGTVYEECVQCTFDICKSPDLYEYEDREISNDEYRDIVRWLNRREFLKFQILDEEDSEHDTCYYNVSFNIDKIKINEKLYGLQLTLESDKPFGYGEEKIISLSFDGTSSAKKIFDTSDEIGYIYPNMIITCKATGDLTVCNKTVDCTMLIKNCKKGEEITINGEAQTIISSLDSHDISNDFNYEFLKISNTYKNRYNEISTTKACNIIIKYSPIIKDAL